MHAPPEGGPRAAGLRKDGGYALVLVLGALALMTLIASQFAARVAALRTEALAAQEHAEARQKISDALAATLFFISTQPGGPAGFGKPSGVHLVADGRVYELESGARVAVLDQRALLSLNAFDRQVLDRLLEAKGAPAQQRDAMLDILLDYQDTDSLRRLNGAEAAEYAQLGLPAPRNDWLVTVRELARMPLWRDRLDEVEAWERIVSTRRSGTLNPNLMPLELVAAMFPWATGEQLSQFDTLRRSQPFVSGRLARTLTGLPFESDNFLFHTSDEIAILAWAPGSPRGAQIQVYLNPSGAAAPWQVTEIHSVAPPREGEGRQLRLP